MPPINTSRNVTMKIDFSGNCAGHAADNAAVSSATVGAELSAAAVLAGATR